MKRSFILAAAALVLAGCATFHRNDNPYQKKLFVERYLDMNDPLDAQIERTINDLRANPRSATLHNELGQLLRQKGFPKDAETEFERAVNADHKFYPAWYNLGLMRQARGDFNGARIAYRRTVYYKHGHAPALFQLGLMEEQSQHTEAAIEYYAKAFAINHQLLDVRVNPRILDSHLVDLALIRLYPKDHARGTTQFEPAPPGYVQTNIAPEAPSPQAPAPAIVTPAPPVTNPAQQTPPPKPPM